MTRQKITTINDVAALVLPSEVLEQLGMAIGDEFELTVLEGALVLRPLAEVAREQTIAQLTQKLLERRQRVYEALATGPAD